MDVRLTEEQLQLRSSAREFLAAECPMSLVRQITDRVPGTANLPAAAATEAPTWQKLWDDMTQLGWLGLVFPERYGGAGLDRVDLAILLEEMGRVLVPAPFFSTVVLGGGAIVVAGSEEQKRDLLPLVASGKLRLSLAQLESDGRWDLASIDLRARSTAGGYSLSGRKLFVPDAGTAHRLVVLARCEAGLTLFLVECETPGVAIRQIDYVDRTRPLFEVTFDDARVEREAILGGIGLAESLLEEVHDLARARYAPRCAAARSGCSI